jgi:hypothetical protein
MRFQYFPGVGMVHLQTVKPARVVPDHERHKWLIKKLLGGQSTSCDKCGCVKTLRRDYEIRYRMPAGPEFTERPAGIGNSSPVTETTIQVFRSSISVSWWAALGAACG